MQKKYSNKSNKQAHNKSQKTRYIVSLIASGFLVIVDQTLKQFAWKNPENTWYLIEPWLGFEHLNNPGIAFGIPIPNTVLVTISPIIIAALGYYLIKANNRKLHVLGTMLLLAGAVSNLIDRTFFDVTIDYVRIYTSVMNIADIMITLGAAGILFSDVTNRSSRNNNQGGICTHTSNQPLFSD